jgi:hypothetical protein
VAFTIKPDTFVCPEIRASFSGHDLDDLDGLVGNPPDAALLVHFLAC